MVAILSKHDAMDWCEIQRFASQDLCRWSYLGRSDYQWAWDIQRLLQEARKDFRIGNSLLLLEHPETYTVGRRTEASHFLLEREQLKRKGAAVIDVDRGGQATYHGPGQLVGYPIVSLRGWGSPLDYVRALEATLIGALASFGVQASRVNGLTGVWVSGRKIAAIGVKISHGVTSHGFAVNVTTDLSWFDHIVPCGIHGREVTSLEHLLGRPVPLKDVAGVVASEFGRHMGYRMEDVEPEQILSLSG